MHQVPVKPLSPAVAFLTATKAAMPSTVGDRVRISAMHDAMDIALRCRFKFDKDDADRLKRFGIKTCVGVFRPLEERYYAVACNHGGTYARMWEAHTGMKPWMALLVLSLPDHRNGRGSEVLNDNRLAVGMGVLIPSDPEDDPDLPRYENAQVWWCTSMTKDEIVLCRYRLTADRRHPFHREGTPAKKWKLTRAQWEALQPKPAEQAAA